MTIVWHDASFMHSSVGATEEQYLPSLATKMPMPCDTCPLFEQCAQNATDCSAFRRWTRWGEYKTKSVGRLIKAFDLNGD